MRTTTAREQAIAQADAALHRQRLLRLRLLRILVATSSLLGLWYITWRWTSSINLAAWWIAVPLVLAETYSVLDGLLFGAGVWRLKERGAAPPPPEGATVDVFITTYNEPIDLVMTTALAARDIEWPHSTWVLDDGAREEMRQAAEDAGIGYVTRSKDWIDRPRHAKAGNLNNALMLTSGEFMLILDADQIPDARILHRTLGWFEDPEVALVQTPQYFVNVPDADPLGSQAPLFYGPIQQGKDGWNAAFFCGSNAVLRREALMQMGVVRYVHDVEVALRNALRTAGRVLRSARRTALQQQNAAAVTAIESVRGAVERARSELRGGEPISEITRRFQAAASAAAEGVVSADLELLAADLEVLRDLPLQTASAHHAADQGGRAGPDDRDGADDGPTMGVATLRGAAVDGSDVRAFAMDASAMRRLAARDWSPLGALEGVDALIRGIDVDLGDEAQPLMPLSTISVTEDMATAMRLHGLGWRSVYHHEVLAHGLAPEDLGSMLHQRLRWAQGTLQVLLRENPLAQPGLSAGQKLMYLSTMWTYLSGFAALVYLAAPILYLLFEIRPVEAYGEDFFAHLIPYLVVNQLLFVLVGSGLGTWRGQQYSLALFPLWIRAFTTAAGNVFFGRSLGFVVTPKTKQAWTPPWRLVRPQLIAMALLVVAIFGGLTRIALGAASSPGGIAVNIVWAVYDLVVLSVIIDAALYRGMEEEATA